MKKIAVVTGSRAEYGLLRPLIRNLINQKNLQTLVFATGMHLSPEFGMSVTEIEKDNITVTEKVEILLSSDSSAGVAKSMSLALSGFSDVFARQEPDLVLLLGDRFEIFSVAAAAAVMKIPIAHIHGGELTLGAVDDAFRHSITKMSSLHFVSTGEYRKRIIQMGENPESVFNVGALGVEIIKNIPLLSREQLEKELSISFSNQNILVTFHPATLDEVPAVQQFDQLLKALDHFPEANLIFTKANADTQGRSINSRIDEYVKGRKKGGNVFVNLGQLRYLSVMKQCDLVLGNSSSGIIEAPSINIPTVNIGSRQSGRVKAKSVIDCPAGTEKIIDAINRAADAGFLDSIQNQDNPYDGGRTSEKITEIIVERIDAISIKKNFYNLGFEV